MINKLEELTQSLSSRRDFLKTALLASSALCLPVGARASDEDFWNLPRKVKLHRINTNEYVEEVYFKDGELYLPGYIKICNLLRDTHENKAVQMDPKLLDLVCAIQAYMGYYGFDKPFIVHSGYRTVRTNNRTEGSAKNSLHIQGRAIDFHMQSVPSNYMGALASHYRGGGVGFYNHENFSHIDTGEVRSWGNKGKVPLYTKVNG